MMNDYWVYDIADRFEKVNQMAITKICEHLREVGSFLPSDVSKINQMVKMGKNIDEINEAIALEIGITLNDLDKLYDESALIFYNEDLLHYILDGSVNTNFADNYRILAYIESVKRLTKNSFINMANSTIISQEYKKALDLAIDSVAMGVENYQNAIKNVVKNLSDNCTRVKYSSGVTRRLDSAVRMNLFTGIREIYNGISKINGETFGADGILISAHYDCAPDHLDIQGKKFTLSEFDKLNDSLNRPISTLNCRHFINYIHLDIPPTYSEEELLEMKKQSLSTKLVNDKPVSAYKGTQMMRNLETRMRYTNDNIIAFDKVGNLIEKNRYVNILNNQKKAYIKLCNSLNNKPQWDRVFIRLHNYS